MSQQKGEKEWMSGAHLAPPSSSDFVRTAIRLKLASIVAVSSGENAAVLRSEAAADMMREEKAALESVALSAVKPETSFEGGAVAEDDSGAASRKKSPI